MRPSMKCLILLFLVSILSSGVLAGVVDVLEPNLNVGVFRSSTTTSTVNVVNTGSADIIVNFSHDLVLTDNEGDQLTLTLPSGITIPAGQTQPLSIVVGADAAIDLEVYSGTVTVQDTITSDTDTFALSIQVVPMLCQGGIAGSDLVLDVEDPDENDDVSPGETINVKVNVENVGQTDIRTQVEAFLFNENKDLTDVASNVRTLDDGDDEDFTLSLVVPIDSVDIEEEDDFTLYVKAFDDDNEARNCVQASVNLNLDLEDKQVLIDEDASFVFPSDVSCGDTVTTSVRVVNIGDDDVDVSVQARSDALRINEQSDTFSLEGFDSDEDNEATRQFSMTLPESVSPGTYVLDVIAKFNGDTDRFSLPVNVVSCDTEGLPARDRLGRSKYASISLPESLYVVAPGSMVSLPVKVSNNLPIDQLLIMSLKGFEEFAEDASTKTVLLGPFQSSTVFLDVTMKGRVEPLVYSSLIEVSDGSSVLVTESVALEVEGSGEVAREGFFVNIPLFAWIVMDLAVVLVIILGVIVVTKLR